MVSASLDKNDCLRLRETRPVWAIYALVLALVAAFFFADLRDFLQRNDDADVFRAHEAIRGDFSFFLSPEKPMASGRIVDEFALYLVYLFCGNDPGAFHLLAAIVHAMASFALAFAFRRLGADMATSLVGGLLFLCNIAHVETVQWISALEYPFAVLNISCTLCVYASYIEGRRRALLLFFYGAVLLCALTHFVSVLVLPLCLLWGWWRGGAIVERAKELAPLLLLLPPVLFFVFGLTGSHTTTSVALHALLNQSVVLLFADSAGSLLWLLGRLLSLAHWVSVVPGERAMVELWLGGAVLLLLLWGIWKGRTEVQIWGLWTLLFTVPFVPAVAVHAGIARYVYLATAGSSFLIAWALVHASSRLGRRGLPIGGVVLLGVVASSYVAEDRIANLTRYHTGRFFVVDADPRVGMSLIDQALEIDRSLIPVAEAHLYLLDGALRAGVDYEEILRRGLHELPEDQDLRLAAQLSAQFAGMAERDDLARLQAEYATGEKVFAHRVAILSQHFGNYYTERGEFAHAVQAYRTSLHYSISAPTNANTAMRLIESQRRNGRYEEAVATVEKVWMLYQDAPDFLYLAALCLLEAGDLDKAQNAIERGLSLTPTANFYALEGEIWAQRGLYERAAEAYRHAISVVPQTPDPFLLLARLHREQGDMASAVEVLERAIGVYPDAALVWYNLGNIRHALGRNEEAAMAYGHAARLNPDHAQAHANLGLLLAGLGRGDEAEAALRRAIAAQPESPVFHHELGMLVQERGDRQMALAELEQAVHLQSQDFATYTVLARLYLDANQHEKALAAYVHFVHGDWRAVAGSDYVRAGIDLQALGAGDLAAEAYRHALERDSGDAAARINLGWLSYERGDYDKAIEQYEHVLAREENATAQFNLGLALLARGDLGRARAAYEEGVELFGAQEAVRIGAVEDLRALTGHNTEAAVLLRQHWPR